MALSPEQIGQLMISVGFPRNVVPTGIAIALAESGGDATIVGGPNSNGTYDYGLFQINSVHSSLLSQYDWRNPRDNTIMAYEIWRDAGKSWHPWATYDSGAYRKYLGQATLKGLKGTDKVDATVENIQPIRDITDPDMWKHLGMIVGGGILVIAALWIYLDIGIPLPSNLISKVT